MIKVQNLTKRYGRMTAVDNISFEVNRGEIIGFLGPNGAGKTTTMRMLTGFFPQNEGTIKIDGLDIFESEIDVKRKIGYLPENVPIYANMTVAGYLNFVARAKSPTGKAKDGEVDMVLGECGIEHMKNRIIQTLSRGYKQRVGLAQALLGDPEILILDEPTIGLDPRQIVEIRNLIKNFAGKRTIILSSHILPEVSQICERVIIINNGKIIAQDKPENLTKRLNGNPIVLFRAEGQKEKVIGAIKQVRGVENVIQAEGPANGLPALYGASYESVDPSSAIADTLVQRGLALWELRREEISLEDIFVKLVTDEDALSQPTKEEGGDK